MKKVISLFILIALFAAFMVPTAYAEGSQTVSITSGSAKRGETITLNVNISGNSAGFIGGKIVLSYDMDALELTDLTKVMFNGNAVLSKGTVNHASAESVTGDGTLATATFKVKNSAKIDEGYTVSASVQLADDDGKFNPTVNAGSVTVYCDHSWSDWETTTAATCIAGGVETRTCSACDKVETRDTNALGHDLKTVTVDSTCTVAGSETTTCSRCDYKETKTLELAPHNFEWKTQSESTCTIPGTEIQVCTVCGGEGETRQIEQLADHTYGDWEVTKEATCTEDGEEQRTCTVCGETTTQPIPKGHDWGDWVETKAPSCAEEGVKTRICNRDNTHIDTRPVEKLPHTWDKWINNEDTGKHERSCSVCGAMDEPKDHDYTDHYEVIDENTHKAFCVCGDSIVENHAYTQEGTVLEKPTTTKEGKQEKLCVCGAKTTVTLKKVPADYDDVPKTGDITKQLLLLTVSAAAVIAGTCWFVFKRKTAR